MEESVNIWGLFTIIVVLCLIEFIIIRLTRVGKRGPVSSANEKKPTRSTGSRHAHEEEGA